MLYQKFSAEAPVASAYSKMGRGVVESVGKIHVSIVRLERLRLGEAGTVIAVVVPSNSNADLDIPGKKERSFV